MTICKKISCLCILVIFIGCTKNSKNIATFEVKYDSSKFRYISSTIIEKEKYSLINKLEKMHEASVGMCNENINILYLNDFKEKYLPEDVCKISSLEKLRIRGKSLEKFPNLKCFYSIKEIELNNTSTEYNNLGKIVIPQSRQSMEKLVIGGFKIEDIVFPIDSKIKELHIINCVLDKIPKTLCNLRYLEVLYISSTKKMDEDGFDVDSLSDNIVSAYIIKLNPEIEKKIKEKLGQKIKLRKKSLRDNHFHY